MRISSSSPSSLSSVGQADAGSDSNQEMIQQVVQLVVKLAQLAQAQQQGAGGGADDSGGTTAPSSTGSSGGADQTSTDASADPSDPSALLKGLTDLVAQLQSAAANGDLSADQKAQVDQMVQALQQAGILPQDASGAQGSGSQGTGYSPKDQFDDKKAHHHRKHHHHHGPKPVEATTQSPAAVADPNATDPTAQ